MALAQSTIDTVNKLIQSALDAALGKGGKIDTAIKAAIDAHVAKYHNTPAPPPPPPITASAILNAPSSASGSVTLSGTLSASATLTITGVTFSANGAAIGSDTTSPYSLTWDTTKVPDGTYAVTVAFSTVQVGVVTSNPISVVVANAVTPPPPPPPAILVDGSAATGVNINGSKLQTGSGELGGGYIGSWGQPGETWLFPVSIAADGVYTVRVRFQNAGASTSVRTLNGVATNFKVTSTDWATPSWTELDVPGVQITKANPVVSVVNPQSSASWSNWLDLNGIVSLTKTA